MEDIKVVHYVTKDPIRNLKVRVTLTRISVQRSKTKLGERQPGTGGQALAPPPAPAPELQGAQFPYPTTSQAHVNNPEVQWQQHFTPEQYPQQQQHQQQQHWSNPPCGPTYPVVDHGYTQQQLQPSGPPYTDPVQQQQQQQLPQQNVPQQSPAASDPFQAAEVQGPIQRRLQQQQQQLPADGHYAANEAAQQDAFFSPLRRGRGQPIGEANESFVDPSARGPNTLPHILAAPAGFHVMHPMPQSPPLHQAVEPFAEAMPLPEYQPVDQFTQAAAAQWQTPQQLGQAGQSLFHDPQPYPMQQGPQAVAPSGNPHSSSSSWQYQPPPQHFSGPANFNSAPAPHASSSFAGFSQHQPQVYPLPAMHAAYQPQPPNSFSNSHPSSSNWQPVGQTPIQHSTNSRQWYGEYWGSEGGAAGNEPSPAYMPYNVQPPYMNPLDGYGVHPAGHAGYFQQQPMPMGMPHPGNTQLFIGQEPAAPYQYPFYHHNQAAWEMHGNHQALPAGWDPATAAAAGAGNALDGAAVAAAAAAAEASSGQSQKMVVCRVFSWQEKVYSKSEVAAMQAAGVQPSSPTHPWGPGLQQQQYLPDTMQGLDGNKQSKRVMALGSQHTVPKHMMGANVQASVLFTYVQSDEFCDREELARSVTTSGSEQQNPLYKKLMANAKNRQQVLNFRTMYIMADLADELAAAGTNEMVLVCIKAYPDGSFDMRPGFSRPGRKYRFEDGAGGLYEYMVENASHTEVPSLEKRTAKLQQAVAERAEELRRATLKLDFMAPPADADSLRLMLFLEIVAAADFAADQLYIEFMMRFDPALWELHTPWVQQEPGVLKGVTHISKMRLYPADVATGSAARWVAHFAHPLELELTSRGAPAANRLPLVFFQVCTMDRFNRYTCEGYAWLPLGRFVPGSGVHYIKAWKPLGTIRSTNESFYIGGSSELEDLTYLTTPDGFSGKALNKYGFKTKTVGEIKIRLNSVIQKFNPDVVHLRHATSPVKGPAAQALRGKKDLSLAVVVERARQRLKDARGGDIAVRPGVASEAPMVRAGPSDLVVLEGKMAEFSIAATGLEPMSYQWYKDDKKLGMATSDSPNLILADVSAVDQGTYYCQVSNTDGSVNSGKASLKVERQSRMARALGDEGHASRSQTSPLSARNRLGNAPRIGRLQAVSASRQRMSPATSRVPSRSNLSSLEFDTAQQQHQQQQQGQGQQPRQETAPGVSPPAAAPAGGSVQATASLMASTSQSSGMGVQRPGNQTMNAQQSSAELMVGFDERGGMQIDIHNKGRSTVPTDRQAPPLATQQQHHHQQQQAVTGSTPATALPAQGSGATTAHAAGGGPAAGGTSAPSGGGNSSGSSSRPASTLAQPRRIFRRSSSDGGNGAASQARALIGQASQAAVQHTDALDVEELD